MAKYKGKSVRLNKPSRITKGQAGYGRKKFKVFVKSGNKVKKVMFVFISLLFVTNIERGPKEKVNFNQSKC